MTTPLAPPKRKNPVERTRLPTLPPASRSREALGLAAMAAEGRFALQVCAQCTAVQYPPRQVCARCLGGELRWRDQPDGGTLLADTVLHHSNDLYFRERLPWRLGLVRLDCGPSVIAHVMEDCAKGARVRASLRLDRGGRAVMLAMPPEEVPGMEDDRELRETGCDPRHRRALITDAKSRTGLALAEALLAAGAREIYAGNPEPWRGNAAFDRLCERPEVTPYDLDVTSGESVHDVASRLGAKVEILVNTGHYLRPGGVAAGRDMNAPRSEMDVNYMGLLRLAREFGPVMRARSADGAFGAAAWVNVLSVYALAPHPELATWSASLAAAASLARSLRAELYEGGVRLINVFPGPVEEEWQQLLPPPKLPPETLARAVVDALRRGLEDVYPGAVAQELRARLAENPKEVEREPRL